MDSAGDLRAPFGESLNEAPKAEEPWELELFGLYSLRSGLGSEPEMILRILRAAHLNHLF